MCVSSDTEMKKDLCQKGGKLNFESFPMVKIKDTHYIKMTKKEEFLQSVGDFHPW